MVGFVMKSDGDNAFDLAFEKAEEASRPLEGMELHRAAHVAGHAAGMAHNPSTMVVGSPSTPFGNDIDYSKRVDYVSEGPCGFAWIVIRPANCRYVNILKKKSQYHLKLTK